MPKSLIGLFFALLIFLIFQFKNIHNEQISKRFDSSIWCKETWGRLSWNDRGFLYYLYAFGTCSLL